MHLMAAGLTKRRKLCFDLLSRKFSQLLGRDDIGKSNGLPLCIGSSKGTM